MDYRRTFVELSNQDVGSSCPHYPVWVESHHVIGGANNTSMSWNNYSVDLATTSVETRAWLGWGQPVTGFGHFLAVKGRDCKLTGTAAGEEKQPPCLTNAWIRNKLLSMTAVCVHPRARTHTDQQRPTCLRRCKEEKPSSLINPFWILRYQSWAAHILQYINALSAVVTIVTRVR